MSRLVAMSILTAILRDFREYSATLRATLLKLTIRSTKSLTLNHSKRQAGTPCSDAHAAEYGRHRASNLAGIQLDFGVSEHLFLHEFDTIRSRVDHLRRLK